MDPSTSTTTSAAATNTTTTTTTISKLNANAEPFTPTSTRPSAQRYDAEVAQHARASGEERSLFMTFSNGSPLTRQEIFQHFTREYGQCVEHVYVHTRHDRDPEFGKITFTTLDLPRFILGDRDVVRISVNNKPIWLKKYIPKDGRNNS